MKKYEMPNVTVNRFEFENILTLSDLLGDENISNPTPDEDE